jgi:type IV secretory pathway VirJ component
MPSSSRLVRRLLLRVFGSVAWAGAAVAAGTVTAFVVILARDPLSAGAAPHAGRALALMPLIETAAKAGPVSDALVVYYTGDNGWRANDRGFTQSLATLGAPVVALDTLHYFVRARTPELAAADLAQVIDRYGAAWRRPKIVLVGYSYGANVLPTIVRRLPPRLRARVVLLALIAPVGRADLALRPWSLMDITAPGAPSTLDELEALHAPQVLCVYGAADVYALCPRLPAALARRVRVEGGHQFVGERDAVTRAIAAAAGWSSRP